MQPDILTLREFYSTLLGKFVRAKLARLALDRWPSTQGDAMLGVGYATPVLRFFLRQSGPNAAIIAAMPRALGAMYWPTRGDNHTVMADAHTLPLAPNAIHRAVVMHALEFSEDAEAAMKELWRVLAPGGRALLCVPNRRSIWSGVHATPFGHGTPYSVAQLRALAERAGFTPMHTDSVVFIPPLQSRLLLKAATVFEWLAWLLPRAGGVLVMEVEKQIYAGLAEPVHKKAAKIVWVPAAGFRKQSL